MFRRLPPQGGTIREVSEVVNGVLNGKSNNTGTITLASGGATSTVITDERISRDSVILLSPKTSNAAGALAGVFFSAQSSAQATISHAANTDADKTYSYVVVG